MTKAELKIIQDLVSTLDDAHKELLAAEEKADVAYDRDGEMLYIYDLQWAREDLEHGRKLLALLMEEKIDE